MRGISFTVGREKVGIVGESGSGKSMTGRAILKLTPPSAQVSARALRFRDIDLAAADERAMRSIRGDRIGMILQDPKFALNPVQTVGRQIAEAFRIHRSASGAEAKQRTLAMLEAVKIRNPRRVFDLYPHEVSGGMGQRIMIAMALALDPVLLIADEPTTALDVTTQAQILRLIKDLQGRHQTGVLFITHDFGVVAEIADRVAVMQFGKLVEFGDAKQILRNPQHPYTRMLISSVPSIKPKHREPIVNAPVVLETTNLSKIYGGGGGLFQKAHPVHAAKEVNLTVRRGETLGIVGESGSGKSTVARCVVRLIDPTSGSINLHDVDIGTLPPSLLRPHRKKVQIVFQDPYRSLNPRRTVGQSIVEGPMNFGLSSKEAWARARDLMKLVGLDPNAVDRFPHQFSGGQRQRICIARALAMEPELLIADEAVSALDVSVQAQVLELLDDVRKRFNLAMLFITHDLRVAAQVCDRVAVMFKGEVVEYGPAAKVFGAPEHEYTRALFDAAPGKDWEFGKFDAA